MKRATKIHGYFQVPGSRLLFRVVKTPNHEIKIDLTYSLKGRGAYLSKDKEVIKNAKKRHILEKSLKITDCQNIYDELLKLLD